MPPYSGSRHLFTQGHYDEDGSFYLSDRVVKGYEPHAGVTRYTVKTADTLWSIAALRYMDIGLPALLFWIIADFQPVPIVDPTIKLKEGTVLLLPSKRWVRERLFDMGRPKVENA